MPKITELEEKKYDIDGVTETVAEVAQPTLGEKTLLKFCKFCAANNPSSRTPAAMKCIIFSKVKYLCMS
tara:strand:+ start:186 stop:392 length:207 start_codon:yes stop_codon:yes gene_type:complete